MNKLSSRTGESLAMLLWVQKCRGEKKLPKSFLSMEIQSLAWAEATRVGERLGGRPRRHHSSGTAALGHRNALKQGRNQSSEEMLTKAKLSQGAGNGEKRPADGENKRRPKQSPTCRLRDLQEARLVCRSMKINKAFRYEGSGRGGRWQRGALGTALQPGGQAGGRQVLLTPPAAGVLGSGAKESCRCHCRTEGHCEPLPSLSNTQSPEKQPPVPRQNLKEGSKHTAQRKIRETTHQVPFPWKREGWCPLPAFRDKQVCKTETLPHA